MFRRESAIILIDAFEKSHLRNCKYGHTHESYPCIPHFIDIKAITTATTPTATSSCWVQQLSPQLCQLCLSSDSVPVQHNCGSTDAWKEFEIETALNSGHTLSMPKCPLVALLI